MEEGNKHDFLSHHTKRNTVTPQYSFPYGNVFSQDTSSRGLGPPCLSEQESPESDSPLAKDLVILVP